MQTRETLLRGAAALALAVAVVGSAVLAPSASAAPAPDSVDVHGAANKPKKEDGKGEDSGGGGGGGLPNLPVIGDVIKDVKNGSPEEIISEVVEFAQIAIPLVRSFLK